MVKRHGSTVKAFGVANDSEEERGTNRQAATYDCPHLEQICRPQRTVHGGTSRRFVGETDLRVRRLVGGWERAAGSLCNRTFVCEDSLASGNRLRGRNGLCCT